VRRGPSLFIEARRCRGRGLAAALAERWPAHAEALEALVRGESPADEVWLLIDGLDELPSTDRRELMAAARRWRGPCVISTRRLPEARREDHRMVVQDLDIYEVGTILEQLDAPPKTRDEIEQLRSAVPWASPCSPAPTRRLSTPALV
jgi:hypothetical protein